MSRIRSLKPGYNRSLDIVPLSIECRYHFALLWTYADDDGRGLDHPALIRSELWPLDGDVTEKRIEKWQAELEERGRIVRYIVAGRRYFQILKFSDHQKPQKKQDSRLPSPDQADTVPLPEESRTATVEVAPVVVGEGSSSSRGEVAPFTNGDDPRFAEFWELCPRKVGKGDARNAWRKAVKKTTADEIIRAAQGLRRQYASTEAKLIPHPATWLNGERWEDEPDTHHAMPNAVGNIAAALEMNR